jgi:hypothetical protein
LGEAEWEGTVLVRKFAHGTTVRFDTSSNKGHISWGSFDIMLDDAPPADDAAPAASYRTAPMPSKTDGRDSAKRATLPPGFFLLDPAVHKMVLHETYDWAVKNAPFVDLPGMNDVQTGTDNTRTGQHELSWIDYVTLPDGSIHRGSDCGLRVHNR